MSKEVRQLEEERNIENFAKWHVPDYSPLFTGINRVSSVTESGRPRAFSPHRYPDDAESSAENCPDYPEGVGLYPSSVSDAPSVTSLYGPGTTRVFDVFQDAYRASVGTCDRRSRKGSLEGICISSLKRRRNWASTVTTAKMLRRGRASPSGVGGSPFEGIEDSSASDLAGLRNAIGSLGESSRSRSEIFTVSQPS